MNGPPHAALACARLTVGSRSLSFERRPTQADWYAEQGATIISAAVDATALTDTVQRQLTLAPAAHDTRGDARAS
jgi:hypothetical protein